MGKLEDVIACQNRMHATACAIAGLCAKVGLTTRESRHLDGLVSNFREDEEAFNTAMKAAQTRETT